MRATAGSTKAADEAGWAAQAWAALRVSEGSAARQRPPSAGPPGPARATRVRRSRSRARPARGDRADGAAQPEGRLVVGQAEQLAQDEGGAVLLGQGGDLGVQHGRELGVRPRGRGQVVERGDLRA